MLLLLTVSAGSYGRVKRSSSAVLVQLPCLIPRCAADNSFTQQELPACRPLLTPAWVWPSIALADRPSTLSSAGLSLT